MSVPRIEIYQIEKALSVGVASVLLANIPDIDPKRQQNNDNLLTPRIEIKCVCNGQTVAPGKVHVWTERGDGSKWVDTFTGTLFLKTVTRRGADQDHYGILGTCRYVMLTQRQAICDAMEFHSVSFPVAESGSTPTIEDNYNQDHTTLSYPFTMRIMFPEKEDQIFLS